MDVSYLRHLAKKCQSERAYLTLGEAHLARNEWGWAAIVIKEALKKSSQDSHAKAYRLLAEAHARQGTSQEYF